MRQAKKVLIIVASGLSLAFSASLSQAEASPITVSPSATGPVSGSAFDNLNPGSAGPTVTFSGSAGYVTGASPYNYAAPVLANGSGTVFGDANGTDTSQYIAVEGGGSAAFQFATLQKYFGLLWGSVDSFNTLSFYDGATLIGAVTGSTVTSNATGDETASGTYYVNLNSSLPFNKVVASSTINSFEFDNIAYSLPPTSVPEPRSLVLFGTGIAMLGFVTRNRRKINRADA